MSLGRSLRSWFTVLAAGLCVLALTTPTAATAQSGDALARLKIAPDLLTTVGSDVAPSVPWARLLNTVRVDVVSSKLSGYVYQPVYGIDIAALKTK